MHHTVTVPLAAQPSTSRRHVILADSRGREPLRMQMREKQGMYERGGPGPKEPQASWHAKLW